MFKKGRPMIAIMAIILLATGFTNDKQPAHNISNTPPVLNNSKSSAAIHENTANYADLYKPIINAYIALEKSGFTSYDQKILSDDVCLLPEGTGSYFVGHDKQPVLMYTFCNLGGDDTPELLIGADLANEGEPTGVNVFVTGIYGLRDEKPVSLIQIGAWSHFVFLTDNSGNCVIEKVWGTHIDYIMESFYKIDKNETLITLDKLYTYGEIKDWNKTDDILYSHTKDVGGKEVSITKQEYFARMKEYGSVGFLDQSSDCKANEIDIHSWTLLPVD